MAHTLPRAEFAVSTSSAANDRPSTLTAVRPAAPEPPPRRTRTETATSAAATRTHSKPQSIPQYPSPKSMPDGRFHHTKQQSPRFEPVLVPRTTAAVSACPTTAPDVRRIAHSHRFSRLAPSAPLSGVLNRYSAADATARSTARAAQPRQRPAPLFHDALMPWVCSPVTVAESGAGTPRMQAFEVLPRGR